MTVLAVRHVTRYRYARKVGFGEHRLMLTPHHGPDQEVIAASLAITPQPRELKLERDRFGHQVAVARFDRAAEALTFAGEAMVRLRPGPPDADLAQVADDEDAAGALQPRHADPDGALTAWARGVLAEAGASEPLQALEALNRAIHRQIRYVRRLERGVQAPVETLARGTGACRDQALLLIEAARRLGFPARFASGYVHCPPAGGRAARRGGGHTHAWARVRAPGRGWIDLDPTSGALGGAGLVRVAAVDEPEQAVPLHGAYIGSPADALGMDVEVEVRQVEPGGLDIGGLDPGAAEPQATWRVASAAA